MKSPQSAGGKATAIKSRKRALYLYYKNPNYCMECGEIIEVGNSKVSEVRKKKFCNRVCSSKYNNKHHPKRKAKKDECQMCGMEIEAKRGKTGKLIHRKYCDLCLYISRATSSPQVKGKPPSTILIFNQSKEDYFSKRKNWQSAASGIRKHARAVYNKNGREKCCMVCGYDKHVQISHIKPVADFPGEASIVDDINHIDNLIALCPNHHWEMDHGLLKIGNEELKDVRTTSLSRESNPSFLNG